MAKKSSSKRPGRTQMPKAAAAKRPVMAKKSSSKRPERTQMPKAAAAKRPEQTRMSKEAAARIQSNTAKANDGQVSKGSFSSRASSAAARNGK